MKYAVFCYDTGNLGDDFQSLAVMSLLDKVPDYYVLRDNYEIIYDKNFQKIEINSLQEPILLICNGWLIQDCKKSWKLYPTKENINDIKIKICSKFIKPFYFSFHLRPDLAHQLIDKNFEAFTKCQKLFCRDEETARICRQENLDACFFGCVTMLLNAQSVGIQLYKERKGILLVDVSKSQLPPNEIKDSNEYFFATQFFEENDIQKRFEKAKIQIQYFSQFEKVFTNRLHVYLICFAINLPCTLIGTICERKRDFLSFTKFDKKEMLHIFYTEIQKFTKKEFIE